MPIDKYIVLRKAAQIDEIMARLDMISDINAAFSGNKEYIEDLRKRFNSLTGNGSIVGLNDKKDPNWKEKLLKYKR